MDICGQIHQARSTLHEAPVPIAKEAVCTPEPVRREDQSRVVPEKNSVT
jgi:hypothetical protein